MPSSSLPIAGLIGVGATRASPIRVSMNGITYSPAVTSPVMVVPSAASTPANVLPCVVALHHEANGAALQRDTVDERQRLHALGRLRERAGQLARRLVRIRSTSIVHRAVGDLDDTLPVAGGIDRRLRKGEDAHSRTSMAATKTRVKTRMADLRQS